MNASGISGIDFDSFCQLMEHLEVLWQTTFNAENKHNYHYDNVYNHNILTMEVDGTQDQNNDAVTGDANCLEKTDQHCRDGDKGKDIDKSDNFMMDSSRGSVTSSESSLMTPPPRQRLVASDTTTLADPLLPFSSQSSVSHTDIEQTEIETEHTMLDGDVKGGGESEGEGDEIRNTSSMYSRDSGLLYQAR